MHPAARLNKKADASSRYAVLVNRVEEALGDGGVLEPLTSRTTFAQWDAYWAKVEEVTDAAWAAMQTKEA